MRRIVSVLVLFFSPTIAGAQYATQSVGLAPVGSAYGVGQSFAPVGGLGTCGNTGAALGTVGYGTCGNTGQAIVQQSFIPQQQVVSSYQMSQQFVPVQQDYVQTPIVQQVVPVVVQQPVYVSRGLGVGYGINRGFGLNRGFGVGSGLGYGVGVGNGIGLTPVGVGRGLFGGRRGRTVIRQRQVIRQRGF